MSFEIHKATRQGVKPLVGFYGKSGSGKTMSALLFARGIVGPAGRIVLCDSESGRGSLFADIIPGGYSVIDIEPPFSPDRYEEAIVTAEKNADCVVVDSLSHEHNGEGGILDMQEAELDRMAGDNWQKREACKMASWIKPKLAHKHFIQRLLRLKCGLICCLRGEEKTHMTKGADGKNKVITDDFSSPLFDPRFLFELLLNFETIARDGKGGYVIPRKITHPSIAALLPNDGEQIGEKHGKALAAWCAAGGTPPGSLIPSSPPAAAPSGEKTKGPKLTDAEKLSRWQGRLIDAGGGRPDYAIEYAVEQGILLDTEDLSDWPLSKLPKTAAEVETILRAVRAKAGIPEQVADDAH